MTTVIETSEIISIEGIVIGEIKELQLIMVQPDYIIFENYQADSQYNKLFVSDTLDDQSLLILAMGN